MTCNRPNCTCTGNIPVTHQGSEKSSVWWVVGGFVFTILAILIGVQS